MNHKELMQELQRRIHLDKQQSALLLASMERILTEEAIATHEVVWGGMGRFVSHKHPEYVEQNPLTGETVLYPPRISYRFQADRTLLDAGLASMLALRTNVEPSLAQSFLSGLASLTMELLDAGEEVEIHGLGTFSMIDVRQGEVRRVAFLPDEKMRDGVNAPFSCFETVRFKEVPAPTAADIPATDVPAQPEASEASEPEPSEPESTKQELDDSPAADVPVQPEASEPEPAIVPASEPKAKDDSSSRRGWIVAAVLLLCIIVGGAAWLFWPKPSQKTASVAPVPAVDSVASIDSMAAIASIEDTVAADSVTAIASVDSVVAIAPVAPAPPAEPATAQVMMENGAPKRVVLEQGERLTLVALEYYGSKVFWPYIFEVNRFQIKDPNNVPTGINLYLPDPGYWKIDSTSEQSISRAKIKAAKLLQEYSK